MQSDYVIVGGGVVGLSIAYGLLRLGRRVCVVDGDDGSFRASRGNFGLVWVQSKGLDAPFYARWSRRASEEWGAFAGDLEEASGVDLALRQDGGFHLHLSDEGLTERIAAFEKLKDALDGDYPYEVLGHNALKAEEPNIGPGVVGATFGPNDGHCNPLRLLRALASEVVRMGGSVLPNTQIETIIEPPGGGFRLTSERGGIFESARVVLCAGLGAATLGPSLGFKAPIRPQRGQVLVTEKLPKLLNRPNGLVRQVDEGGVQIGDSKEEVGFDDSTTIKTTSKIAAQAIAFYPMLSKAKLVRSWAALRIMTPDGLPIYQQSLRHPGAFLVTCHSGITLASLHARVLPQWLEGHDDAPNLADFSEERFDV